MKPSAAKKAMSVVLSTIILASAILTITMAAIFVSNTVLEQQLDQSEFEQAKNNLVTLVDIIEHVAVNPGSSGYIRLNLRTARPNFERNAGTIEVTVQEISVIRGYTGSLHVGGGRNVGVGGKEVLIGSDELIITSASDPLGYVYVVQQNGAWVNLDYERVRATYLGKYLYHEGGSKVNRSVVRISFINITFGEIRTISGGVLNLAVRNVRTQVQTYLFPSANVQVEVSFNGRTESVNLGSEEQGQYPATETVVYVVRMDLEIASL
ncbi:MAG: hypothetical protein JTT11_10185 [Candidatus Brockarchaeota archaeon]|nr:hypothetical protein [Candidatus Brockarchaeota archaeon]